MPLLSKQSILALSYSVTLGLLPLIGSSLTTYLVIKNLTSISQFDYIKWALFFFVTAFTMAFALTPTTLIALLSGYLLGWPALLPLCFSYLLASWMGYQTIGFLDNGSLLQFLAKRPGVNAFISKLQQGSLQVIIFSRLSPILPFAVMNAVFSLVKIPIRPFLWGSLWGMLPRTILSIWAGTQAYQLSILLEHPNQGLTWRIGLAGLTLISVLGLGYVIRQITRK
ncbi:TVP38/TMEM64 family protein [Xanthocytophaga agilis]|uniref:TVP38/TMEM64 family membrane protein n=1 Tax=Xanthocytophaga agilis TaxID=3048010 RepID=A0AAE3R564_9BACT|nr:VTT domain-containing protein [Xanthocytophaga agilis]MDJ1501023.1 VTT domain-containing protein [Xanthocytophaga agilis]